jgi:ectoine hydroxylase-related dioxygenase (phytanoyl-CoA dioxygenase family)
MQGLKCYGITEFTHSTSQLDSYAEELHMNGYAIIPDLLDEATVESLRGKVDEIYKLQKAEVAAFGDLDEINDANVVRALLAYDDSFLDLALQPIFLSIAERMLGKYFILQMQNGIINLPHQKSYQSAWHRDLNYQHFVCTRSLAISVLVCLDNFSEETGGTRVVAGTHKVEAFPSEPFILKNLHNVTAKAGSALVMDSMLYHCAGDNSSGNVRRAINHVYGLPFIKQQISFPRMLGGKHASDPFLKLFLGYDSESGASVTEWRKRKFEKLALLMPEENSLNVS